MQNTKRKGFTIVELVIVIAVIAILAAILIPTFANLVEKANTSADIQAVKNMNTSLSLAAIDGNIPTTDAEAYAIVAAAGYRPAYKPVSATCDIAYDLTNNVFVLFNLADGTILFPENISGTVTGINTDARFFQAVFVKDASALKDDFSDASTHTVVVSNNLDSNTALYINTERASKTIDLNGATINGDIGSATESVDKTATLYIGYSRGDAKLVLKDTSSDGSGKIKATTADFGAVGSYGDVVVEGGQYISEAASTDGFRGFRYLDIISTTEIKGGTFEGTQFGFNNCGTATISGGTFIGGTSGIGNCGDLTIDCDLTIEGLWWANNGGNNVNTTLTITAGHTLTINGGELFIDARDVNTMTLTLEEGAQLLYIRNGITYSITATAGIATGTSASYVYATDSEDITNNTGLIITQIS